MQELIILNELAVEVDSNTFFKIDHLAIKKGEIIGLIGQNGSGKSTLLNILSGKQLNYQGKLDNRLALSEIVYVKQEVDVYHEQDHQTFNHHRLNQKWQLRDDFASLSGGEKLKKRLKDGLNQASQLLLLDEPTNHLDEESVDQLVNELKSYRGALVIVSHDRYFLDQIATMIWSIEDQTITSYPGNYSKFAKLREEAREAQRREYGKQQQEIKEVASEMQQLHNWSTSAHAQSTKKNPRQIGSKEYYRVKAKRMDTKRKSIEKRLTAKLEKHSVERVKEDYTVMFEMDASKLKQGPLYIAEKLKKQLGERLLFEQGNVTIMFGDRMALTGKNGSGKTTFLKILLGQESYEGKLWSSTFAEIGYLSQEVFDLPGEVTIADYFDVDRDRLGQVMTLFIHLGFLKEQWLLEIGQLSMGERVKIKLMSHIISEKNVLILDEPTNHLDIAAREELERVLESYQGSLIFVSHDRYFREKIASRTLEIREQRLVPVSEQVKENPPVDRLLLEFQRDELLSTLSILANNSPEYAEVSAKFENVLQQLKES